MLLFMRLNADIYDKIALTQLNATKYSHFRVFLRQLRIFGGCGRIPRIFVVVL